MLTHRSCIGYSDVMNTDADWHTLVGAEVGQSEVDLAFAKVCSVQVTDTSFGELTSVLRPMH